MAYNEADTRRGVRVMIASALSNITCSQDDDPQQAYTQTARVSFTNITTANPTLLTPKFLILYTP
jgi:hypothetical protein